MAQRSRAQGKAVAGEKMAIDEKEFLNSILKSFSRMDYIKPEDIPDIDLYMDQVTTFMDEHLAVSKRRPEDKVLTKTMINNYAKNDLLPPPVKKKYSKEHIIALIFIYYYKNVLSIGDIHAILGPIVERYFGSDLGLNLADIYSEIFRLEKSEAASLRKDIMKKYHASKEAFQDAGTDERTALQRFAFICMLCFDVYVKKRLVEKLIDMQPENGEKDPKKSK